MSSVVGSRKEEKVTERKEVAHVSVCYLPNGRIAFVPDKDVAKVKDENNAWQSLYKNSVVNGGFRSSIQSTVGKSEFPSLTSKSKHEIERESKTALRRAGQEMVR